jgi:hypothetical protein
MTYKQTAIRDTCGRESEERVPGKRGSIICYEWQVLEVEIIPGVESTQGMSISSKVRNGVFISQKMTLFIVTAVETSNLT